MERWVEAVLSPTDQAKCDLLGVRVMQYVGVFDRHDPVYSVRKLHPYFVKQGQRDWNNFVNLCTARPDTTAPEVAIFRSTDAAILGATNKKYFFPGVT